MSLKIIQLLKHFSIPFWTSGKNVSENSINIKCPFCSDTSNHLGIFKDTNLFSCWKCNEKGNLFKLIHKLTGITYKEYKEITENININFKISIDEQIENIIKGEPRETTESYKKGKTVEFPKYSIPITRNTKSELLERFLSKRQISIDKCIKNRCQLCKIGEYSHRMIIPIYFINKLVGFQAVDLTGQSMLKYKTSKTDINEYLYNFDEIPCNNKIILVEGILDAWRIGENSLCHFGTHLTNTQKKLIIGLQPKELIFCWDGDAWWKARKQAKFFLPFIEKIKVVCFPKEYDPDSYGRDYGKDTLLEFIKQTDYM